MAKTQTAEVLLKYSVDSASANRVRQSFAELEYGLSDLRTELTGMGSSAQAGIANLRTRFVQGEQSVVAMQDEVEELRRDLLKLDDVTVTPTVAVQQTGGGGAGLVGGLNTLDQIGRIGTQVGGGLGASGLGNSVNLIGDIAGAAATMNPLLIGSAAAIGAVSLVTMDLTRAYNEAREAAADYLAKQTEINLLLAQGDTESLEAQRERLTAELEARAQTAEPLRALVDRFWELMQRPGSELGMTFAEITAELDKIPRQIYQLTNGRIDNIQAAGDELAQFDAETQNIAGDLALVELGLARVVDKMVEFGDKASIALDEALKASKGIKGASDGIQGGIASGSPFADTFAAQQSALMTTRTDAYLAAMTRTVEAQEALTKAQQAYDEAVRASGARIAEINAKLQADLAEAETERQNELAEAAEKAGEDRVRITEDAEKERAAIEKRFARSHNQAVGDRDALAAARAEQARDDELDQLKDRYKDQLSTVDKSLAQQQKLIQSRYDQQVRTAYAAHQTAIRAETDAANARLNVLRQTLTAAQTAMINASNAELQIRANLYNQSISQAQIWANTIRLYTDYAFALPNGGGGSVKMPVPIPGKAAGGPIVAGRPYVVGEAGPEVIIPRTSGYVIPNGAGMSININVAGATVESVRATSRQQALIAFGRVLDRLGAA